MEPEEFLAKWRAYIDGYASICNISSDLLHQFEDDVHSLAWSPGDPDYSDISAETFHGPWMPLYVRNRRTHDEPMEFGEFLKMWERT
jgi:hypothetical protein